MRSFGILLIVANLLITGTAQAQTILLHNFNGYTLTGSPGADAELRRFSAMLVRDGKVAAIGTASSVSYFRPMIDTEVDLQGKTLLPGIIDAHGHVLGLGQNLQLADLRDATSVEEAVQQVKTFSEQAAVEGWIMGRGWNQENWSVRAFPTAEALDEAINNQPVWLTRVDGHAGWANSKALELAGIDASTVSPEGGEIIRDNRGHPTGVLIDNAMALVEKAIPQPTKEQQRNALNLAFEHLLARGITNVHDAGVDAVNLQLYREMAAAGEMPMRVYAMLSANEPELLSILSEGPVYTPDDRFTMRSVKIYADGALGSRGAALLEPYHDDKDQLGLLVTQPERLHDLYQIIIPMGFQINTHAIGDRANRLALDEFERAFATIGGRNLRHRIEHAQVVHPDDLKRFKELNIIPSMQPTHATSDKNMAEDRLGKARMEGAYAWQTLLDQGSIIAGGSDFPVELADPFFGLHAAVTRQDRDDQPAGGWYPHEAMTLTQAFRAFTLDAAYAAYQEQMLGSLEPGKWADFIVLDQDPFAQDQSKLWQQKVLATYVAGDKVFAADTE